MKTVTFLFDLCLLIIHGHNYFQILFKFYLIEHIVSWTQIANCKLWLSLQANFKINKKFSTLNHYKGKTNPPNSPKIEGIYLWSGG